MTKKKFTAFIFGSTALATSMSFLPLADANAHSVDLGQDMLSDSISISVAPIHAGNFKTASVAAEIPTSSFDHLAVSMIAVGSEDLFTETSLENGTKAYLSKSINSHLEDTIAGFTLEEVKTCVDFSKAAYEVPLAVEDRTKIQSFINQGYTVETFGDVDKDYGVFAVDPDNNVTIAFSGSAGSPIPHLTFNRSYNPLNWEFKGPSYHWRNNFDGIMAKDSETGGRYHKGMLKGYNQCAPELYNKLMVHAANNNLDIQDVIGNLTLTGHSRGAGISQIAAIQMWKIFGISPKECGIAAPRSVHKKTADDYSKSVEDKKMLTIAQDSDPVHTANRPWWFGAKHVGEKVKIGLNGVSAPHMMDGIQAVINTVYATGSYEGITGTTTFEKEEHKPVFGNSSKNISVQDTVRSVKKAVKSVWNTTAS